MYTSHYMKCKNDGGWHRVSGAPSGFTIVELVIVIVVIAILSTISIVAYGNMRNQADSSRVQASLVQAVKKIQLYYADNADTYPQSLSDIGVSDAANLAFQYSSNNSVSPREFAVTASNGVTGSIVYYQTSTISQPVAGIAPGHNLIPWKEPDSDTAPVIIVPGVTIDLAQFRSGAASIRLSPGRTGAWSRLSPFTGSVGQVVTVRMWLKTDSNWNGTMNNSKIRFGSYPAGSLQYSCSYDGVKIDWTLVSCSYTLNASNTSTTVTFGNDATVGYIWIDDLSISIK